LYGPLEVLREIRTRGGQPVLVLVRQDYLYQLMQSDVLNAEVLKGNEEWSLVLVSEEHISSPLLAGFGPSAPPRFPLPPLPRNK
jgi:hypothetical protein